MAQHQHKHARAKPENHRHDLEQMKIEIQKQMMDLEPRMADPGAYRDVDLAARRVALHNACRDFGAELEANDDFLGAAQAYRHAHGAIIMGTEPNDSAMSTAREQFVLELARLVFVTEMPDMNRVRDAILLQQEILHLYRQHRGRLHIDTLAAGVHLTWLKVQTDPFSAQSAVDDDISSIDELERLDPTPLINRASLHTFNEAKFELAQVLERLGNPTKTRVADKRHRKDYLRTARRFYQGIFDYLQHCMQRGAGPGDDGAAEEIETMAANAHHHFGAVLFLLRSYHDASEHFAAAKQSSDLLSSANRAVIGEWIERCHQKEGNALTHRRLSTHFHEGYLRPDSAAHDRNEGYTSDSSFTSHTSTSASSRSASREAQRPSTSHSFRSGQDEPNGDERPGVLLESSEDNQNRLHPWFKKLEDTSHSLLGIHNGEWIPTDQEKKEKYSHTKIAILDSGIDGSLSEFKTCDKIVAWRDCMADEPSDVYFRGKKVFPKPTVDKVCFDNDGHGTHLTALIRKINPLADLYIARIMTNRGEKDMTPENVAKAIRHATDSWQVDVITMSLGFAHRVNVLTQAIGHAYASNVLMLAAASNDGINEPSRKYPANYDAVICVSASDYKGMRASGQASQESSKNFITWGVDVRSAWPRQGTGESTYQAKSQAVKSGSSVATAIMTASVSLFFEFVKRQVKYENDSRLREALKHMRDPDGMRAILRGIGSSTDNFCYIAPWLLLPSPNELYKAKSAKEQARDGILDSLSKEGFPF